MNAKNAFVMMMAAGAACAAGANETVPQEGQFLRSNQGIYKASIYINAATGERVELGTNGSGLRGIDDAQARVWVNNNSDPCNYGDPDGADNIPGTADDDQEFDGIGIVSAGTADGSVPVLGIPAGPSNENDSIRMHWGDVPADSRVDGLGFWVWHNYRGDGVETEIPGFDVTLGFYDRGDGRDLTAGMGIEFLLPTLLLTFTDLPPADPLLGTGYINGFYFLADLGDADPLLDLTFELGDSDGMGPANGVFFNANSFYDSPNDVSFSPEAVGLHDFAYTIAFNHPADRQTGEELAATTQAIGDVTYLFSDTDGDGDTENTFVPLVDNGIAPGSSDDFNRTWNGGLDATTGLPTGYVGAFFFGGFTCGFSRADSIRAPHSRIYMELYLNGASGPEFCLGDWDQNGMVNIFDILAFLGDWNVADGMMGAGIPEDFNGDMTVNVFDILAFLGQWNTDSMDPSCVITP